jgi:nitrate reductase delta subunit
MAHTFKARTFKALGLLLSYPSVEVAEVASAAAEAIAAEGLLPARLVAQLELLAAEIATEDRFDLEGRYHQLFDRSRSLSLNLFEHVHGESRDRGQAMVELVGLYETHGYLLDARELPDYLPLFLEFLSSRPVDEARALLGEAGHVVAALAERLKKRRSPYQWPMLALAHLAAEADPAALKSLLAQAEDDPDDLEELDRIWAEEAVAFGPGTPGSTDGCPRAAALVDTITNGA